MVLKEGSFNLGGGDQIIAYQKSTPGISTTLVDATFIAAITSDYDAICINNSTGWTQDACVSSTSESILPPGLTNGLNAVSMTPTGPEKDNFRYNGSLTGTSTAIRLLINDYTNWLNNNGPSTSTIYDNSATTFSPSITCSTCNNPTIPTATYSPSTICNGNTTTLTISGNLNDATEWTVYTGSCGGTLVGATTTNTLTVTPSNLSTTYYIRGLGNCVSSGSCGTVTVTQTTNDSPAFNYSNAIYCQVGTDPTPTITGLAGGTFSAETGLSLNTFSGIIDLSASTSGIYNVKYVTNGTCPDSSTANITIGGTTIGYDIIAACDSYTWINGNTYTASNNTATHTLTNSLGCDSLVILNLTINKVEFTVSTTDVSCFGGNDGAASTTITNGSSPFFYSWYDNANTNINPTLAFQSFESNVLDTWSYTVSPVTYATETDSVIDGSEDIWAVIREFTNDIDTASNGINFWGTQDLNNPNGGSSNYHTITFDPIDVSTQGQLKLEFDYYSKGFDGTDLLEYEILFDNGTTWSPIGTGLSKNNLTWETVSINVPAPSNYVRLRIQVKQNGSSDFSGWDNIKLVPISSSINNLTTNNYSVSVTDNNGCIGTSSFTITEPNAIASIDIITACNTHTWIDGNTYTANNNVATHTLTSIQGCDSIVTLNLTILTTITSTDTQVACNSFIWIDGNTYTTNNNTATHTLTSILGCDSIVTLNLTINSSNTGMDTQTACDSFTWIDGNTYTSNNSIATYTLTNINGCDSVVTLNLTINNSNTGIDTQVACDSYTWIDGNTYTSSNNVATHILTNTIGCDSVVTLNLTINNSNTGVDLLTMCNSFTWIDGVTYTTSNNIATHTLTNSNGCDSIVTLNLTIVTTLTAIDNQTACNSYTWIDGNTYTSNNNIATHTLTSSQGCDSIVTLNLTLNNSSNGVDTEAACNSFTWIDGNTYTSSNNIATHTLTNQYGCDSIVTLDLTINNSSLGTDTQSACNNYTWIDGITYTTNNTTATHTLTNAVGCDSVVTLNLTIGMPSTGIDTQITCSDYTWIDGVTYTTNNNTATHTLTNAAGCDSVITLNLTINSAVTFSQNATICGGEIFTVGTNNHSTSGTYTDVLIAASGCDSIVTTNLTVESEIDTYVERLNDVFKVATISGATYQWLDCENNNSPIAGANSSTYTATSPGVYAVVITVGNCTDTSICNELPYIVGMKNSIKNRVSVYPNPTEDKITIELNENYSNSSLTILDVTGKVIYSQKVQNQLKLKISTEQFEKGVYFIRLQTQNQSETIQLIKQ